MGVQVQAPIALTSGAFTPITAKTYARKVLIAEDGLVAPGGITVQWPNGNTDTYTPAQQPVVLENPGGGSGGFLGVPADSPAVQSYVGLSRAATVYCSVKSVGATGSLRVTEEN
jgi:hypothetical protein